MKQNLSLKLQNYGLRAICNPITREGNGTGTVIVTKPDGRTRATFFENGAATGYDMSQADRGEFSTVKQGDLNIIQIGQERYEIPDAVIFDG